MTVGERIKFLRKTDRLNSNGKMTLDRFGSVLGVTGVAISRIENGDRRLTDQMFKSICREFNVNESWLRDGIGEPFVEKTRREQIVGYLDRLSDVSDNVRKRFADALDAMEEDDWRIIREIIDQIERDCIARKGSPSADVPVAAPPPAGINENVDAPAAIADLSPEEREVVRQLREKKRRMDV